MAEEVGAAVGHLRVGSRVCVHYLAFCGQCRYCAAGQEPFCATVEMIGKHRDGGFAEYVRAPAASVLELPEEIPFEAGAVMMCSSATALHAWNKAELAAGESVAIFGFGGLGFSALQLARALGAAEIFVVEVQEAKLRLAAGMGGIPIDPKLADPADQIGQATKGRGVDIALELAGLPATMDQAVRSLGIFGRAALVGLSDKSFPVAPYANLINKEARIIGVSDHLASELPGLLAMARAGRLEFPEKSLRAIPLEAAAINAALDVLEGKEEAGGKEEGRRKREEGCPIRTVVRAG
jgi:D-arabinose 1-dehydrogenase-like Zn-dependent alcohol dehydrogenase